MCKLKCAKYGCEQVATFADEQAATWAEWHVDEDAPFCPMCKAEGKKIVEGLQRMVDSILNDLDR